jgi:hypothetical protein
MNRAGWAELSHLSTDLDRPLEDLLIEAANDLLAKHTTRHVTSTPTPPANTIAIQNQGLSTMTVPSA